MRRLLGVIVVLLLVVGGASIKEIAGGSARTGTPVTVVIERGATGSSVARILERAKVIGSSGLFRVYLRARGLGSAVQAGEYKMFQSMSFSAVVATFASGPVQKFERLTIPEGLTVAQTAEQVGRKTHVSAKEFLAAATPATAHPQIAPTGITTLEGFLYPSTYYVGVHESAARLVRRMVDEFDKRTKALALGGAQDDLTPYQVLILASMIETETKAEPERAKVSAVIHNRLRIGMTLGIDATIKYAVNKYHGEPLTRSDLEVDSPYNTRRYAGLPPTPIASPRVGSIAAAIDPGPYDYLFYVLTQDCIHHFFTRSSAEFERARRNQPRNC